MPPTQLGYGSGVTCWRQLWECGLPPVRIQRAERTLARRVAPDDYGHLHHFVCASCWPPERLERVLAEKAQALGRV